MLFKFVAQLILGSFYKLFGINRDEEIGALKEANKSLTEQNDEIEKANSARNNTDLLASVHKRFTRD